MDCYQKNECKMFNEPLSNVYSFFFSHFFCRQRRWFLKSRYPIQRKWSQAWAWACHRICWVRTEKKHTRISLERIFPRLNAGAPRSFAATNRHKCFAQFYGALFSNTNVNNPFSEGLWLCETTTIRYKNAGKILQISPNTSTIVL